VCREKALRSIFEEYGEVEAVQILKQSADKNMALVKFYSFEDSFRAAAELHNAVFSGRKMQISFTKSRI
jgi:RNA recognition motif-containing protein